MSCELKRITWDPNSQLFISNFKDFVLITILDFSIVPSVGSNFLLTTTTYGDRSCWVRPWVFNKFLSFLFSFLCSLFLSLFSLLFHPFLLFLCLSDVLVVPGPLDIVPSCHPLATLLWKTIRTIKQFQTTESVGTNIEHSLRILILFGLWGFAY